MIRLSPATLSQLRPGTGRPLYDRAMLRPRIVHLGLGAFARAHLARYTEDVLNAPSRGRDGADWGIAGVSLRHADQRDRLQPQDGLFTALERDGGGTRASVIGSVVSLHVAPEDPAAVVRLLAAPETAIVSLTVTEKGYCHDPATGRLDAAHPDISHDLAHADSPRSAVGLLVAALAQRRQRGQVPFTVLTCDNLPANGPLLAGLVRDFAALRDAALASWIEARGAFPATMVDRIVPATTPADLDAAAEATGLSDVAPVTHEPFRQWVIEDRFAGDRPAWEHVGAQIVTDVAPFEHMKLRLLNGAHSALAYLGYLAGHETICDAVGDPVLRRFVQRLWGEILPMVPPPPGVALQDYTASLLTRFANPAIRHRTWQIAMDGSQKLPQRLLATIRERLHAGLPVRALAVAVAAWIRYVGGIDEAGRPIDVRDPLAAQLRGLANGPDAVRQVLSVQPVFGADLGRDPRLVAAVTDAFDRLVRLGARGALA
ncbi:MAG TPA: mannitol dehydrogenase family protein [Rhodopila sp.]|nr:mannitol dehydrogenase family protein [Rhodopila sp.]